MTLRYYDVVVLGRGLGALVAAALLARRDFTVLVVGQEQRGATYRLGERVLLRRAFTLLAGTSPLFQRILAELAEAQSFRRRAAPLRPMLQLLAPGTRLELPPDMDHVTREIEREFPGILRAATELYGELARVNAAADEAFERDIVCPPGSFWERRETGRAMALLPYVRAEADADLLADFPPSHLYRQLAVATALFASDLSALPPPFAVARLHGAWTRGPVALPGGEEELEQLLVDRIRAHGGRVAFEARAASLHIRRGALAGVVIDGEAEPTGAAFVVSDLDGESLAALSRGEGVHRRAQREWPRVTSGVGRFVVSIVVRGEGVPRPLADESFFLPAGVRPALHVQRGPASAKPGEVLLVAELLLAERGGVALHEARELVLGIVASELPYLARHLLLVDSPHDGLPVWAYEGGVRRNVERSELTHASRVAEPMVRCLEVDPPGYLGLSGEPIRGPIERSFLVGPSVMPALGQEGRLLAAWGAARLITKTDRQKERMRRAMWTKQGF